MAYLPPEPVTFAGGCHCKAIRYKISIPALEDRPQIPGIPDTQILDTTEDGKNIKRKVPTAIPCVVIDHCGMCRHASGAPLQFWFIILARWTEWTLEARDTEDKSEEHPDGVKVFDSEEVMKQPFLSLSSADVCGPNTDMKIFESTYISQYTSSPELTRIFCSRCGTNLAFNSSNYVIEGDSVIDVAVGSLDDESLTRIHPERHMWWDSGIDWVKQLFRPDTRVCMKHPMGSPFGLVDEEEVASAV